MTLIKISVNITRDTCAIKISPQRFFGEYEKLGTFGNLYITGILSIYLLDFSSLYLAKMFVWGMDGYSIIVAVEQLALLGLFIYWA